MENLIYILAVGFLAATLITFRVIDALAKELAELKKKLNEWKKPAEAGFFISSFPVHTTNKSYCPY